MEEECCGFTKGRSYSVIESIDFRVNFISRVDIVIGDIVVGYLFVFGLVCGWVFFKEGNRICEVDF